MSIGKLIVQDLRNLDNVSVELHSDLNFIIGDNGSGKSSLLEAIFYLGHGKSFRSSKVDNLLQHINQLLPLARKQIKIAKWALEKFSILIVLQVRKLESMVKSRLSFRY